MQMGVAVGWGTVMFDDRFEILCDCLCVFTCFDYSVMCKLITEEYNRMRHARVIKNTARRDRDRVSRVCPARCGL